MRLNRTQRQSLAWTALAVVLALLVWLLSPVLMPFIVAAVLAYALHPAVQWLAKHGLPRLLAVVLVEVVAIIAIVALLLLVVPIVSKELPLLREQIPLLAARLNTTLSPWLAQFGFDVSLDIDSIKAFVVQHLGANLEDWSATLLSSARIGGSVLLSVIGNAVLIPVVLFYLLIDWRRLNNQVLQLIPLRMRAGVQDFLDECDQVLGQYLRGQLLVMLILAVLYSGGLMLFGFELALPVGVFTGLAVFIPYLGFGLGLLLALLAGVLQFGNWYGLIAVAVVYGVGQVAESAYLTPRLVGERIGLNPLAVIFLLLAFGHLFGFVGILIALPLSAILSVVLHRLRAVYVNSRLFLG
jgi:predicted PurR-regulated permease PerM